MAEFCKAGGHVPSKSWVPIGNKDFSSVIAAIPDDVDAIYVALGGADAVNFLTQYEQGGGTGAADRRLDHRRPDGANTKGKHRDVVMGTPSAGPTADTNDTPGMEDLRRGLQEAAGRASRRPSLFAHGYYVNMKAALLGARPSRRRRLGRRRQIARPRCRSLDFETPTGKVSLDKNRNAIADIFLTEVTEGADGNLYNKLVKVVPQVNQTLGIPEDEFLKLGAVGRDNPILPVSERASSASRQWPKVSGLPSSRDRRVRAGAGRRGAAFRRAGGALGHHT